MIAVSAMVNAFVLGLGSSMALSVSPMAWAAYQEFSPAEIQLPLDMIVEGSTDSNPDKPSQIQHPGRLLYENHCRVCHDSVVHIRSKRKAASLPEVRQWVGRWVKYLKLDWDEHQREQVVHYLNLQFYHFPFQSPSKK